MEPDCSARPLPENGVSVMVFTLDEELNLPSCLASLDWCDDVIVVDSFSTDETETIARRSGARFYQHSFEGFGSQRNWALDEIPIRHSWVLILDADERVPPELAAELRSIAANASDEVGAYQIRRRFHMWGSWLRHSSLYPTWVVRFIRVGRVRYVNRGHSETQELTGELRSARHDLIDDNRKGLSEWFERQNRYARKEAAYELAGRGGPLSAELRRAFLGQGLERRSGIKHLAARMPMRALVYFLYAYLWRGGFRDGRNGLVFCTMKSVYQQLIQIHLYDLERAQAAGMGTSG